MVSLLVIDSPVHGQDTTVTEICASEGSFNSSNPIPLTRLADREANINIDGRVNDLAWSGLPIYNELRVLRPDTLKSAPYRTDVRFFSGSTRSETAISVWFLDMAYVNCVNATTSLAI